MAIVEVKMPPGTIIEETHRVTKMVGNLFLKEKGVETVLVSVGISEGAETDAEMGTGPSGPHEASIFVRLLEKKHRQETTQKIIEKIKKQLPKLEGVEIEFMDMGRTMLTGGGREEKPVDIKIFGKELKMLEAIAEEVKNRIEKIKGITDISFSEKGKPELVIRINREKANRLGLSVYQIAQEVQTAVKGRIATRLHWEGEEIDLKVRLTEKDRQTIKDIERLNIPIYIGGPSKISYIPLNELAELTFERGPVKLKRENQKRVVSVSANVLGHNIGKVMSNVKAALDEMSFPEGYFVKYGGEAEKMRETFRDLTLILLLAIVLIYMVMAAEFESFVHPFVIMFTLPFSIIGVLLGLLVTGKAISLPVGMGVLILCGIIVNNGIVLVDYTNQLRHKGKNKYDAIVEACITRLRPVLMTALTTILAMLPMIISQQEGVEIRSVVSTVIVGGLAAGTVLTLIVLPVIYTLIDDFTTKLSAKVRYIIRKE